MRSPTPSRCSSSGRRWRLAVRTIASMSCAPHDLGQLGELAQHRHDRVREIADEADQLDAVRLALVEGAGEPRRLLARAQAQHAQRALGRPRAVLAHVPAGDREEAEQGGGDEPERLGARVQEGSGSDDERRDECGGLGMADESDGERAVVLTAVAQEGRADQSRRRPSRRAPRRDRWPKHRTRIPRQAASPTRARAARPAPARARANVSAASPDR